MSQVIVFPRGQLTPADRAKIAEVGIVAVEADDPSSVVTVIPGAPLASSDDLVMSALAAIAGCGINGVGMDFVRLLHTRLKACEAKEPTNG